MAEETIVNPSNDHPDDFAAVAQRLITTDPDKAEKLPVKIVEKAPEKVEQKSKIPDGIFEEVKPEKKVEEKKIEEASDFDKIEDPQFRDEKRKAQWEEVKAKGREFEKQDKVKAQKIAEQEAKIKEFEAKGKDTEALNEKLAKLEKEHGEAMALVRKVNAELDPEYQRKFGEGRKNLLGQAKTIVEESGGNPKDIETALNLSGKSRADALGLVAESLNSFQAVRLGRVIDALTELDAESEKVRSNPEEYLQQRAEQESTRQRMENEERAKIANSAFESAMSRASSESEVLRPTSGSEEWTKQGQEIKARATEFWRNNRDPEKAARVMIDGFTTPVFRQLFLDQRKEATDARAELESLKQELEGLYKKGPKSNGASSASRSGPIDFADQAHGLMNGSITR